jgi:hypothetical protein
MKKQMPGGRWSLPGDGNGKAVIILGIGGKQVQKHENSHFSRMLGFWAIFRSNLLPCNPFQLNQTNGFLGFRGNFSGGGIPGGGSKNPNPSSRLPGRSATIALISGQKYDSNQTPSHSVAANHSDLFTASRPVAPKTENIMIFQNFSISPVRHSFNEVHYQLSIVNSPGSAFVCFVPFVVIRNFRQSAMILRTVEAFPSLSIINCPLSIQMACQPNRGNNLKLPKKPKSVQCRGQLVTAPCRVVTAFVTGCPMPKSLTDNKCDGVAAPDPWTPRPVGWFGGCPNPNPMAPTRFDPFRVISTCFDQKINSKT